MLKFIKAGREQIFYDWDGDDTAFPIMIINRGQQEVIVDLRVRGDLFGPSLLVIELGAVKYDT